MCKYSQAYNSITGSEHRMTEEKLTLGLAPFNKTNPFLFVPHLWEGEIFFFLNKRCLVSALEDNYHSLIKK